MHCPLAHARSYTVGWRRWTLLLILHLGAAGCASPMRDAKWLADAEREGVCPVHDQEMEVIRVPITYGLVMGTPKGLRAWELAHSPFARREVLGGCLVVIDEEHPERGSPESTDILVCADCDATRARWMQRNPTHPWTKWWRNGAAVSSMNRTAGSLASVH
jgi:hypothetical protein